MPIPTDTYWNIKRLNKVFAASSILLTLTIVAAVWQDYNKAWRVPQRNGRTWEAALVRSNRQSAMSPAQQAHLRDLQEVSSTLDGQLKSGNADVPAVLQKLDRIDADIKANPELADDNERQHLDAMRTWLNSAQAQDEIKKYAQLGDDLIRVNGELAQAQFEKNDLAALVGSLESRLQTAVTTGDTTERDALRAELGKGSMAPHLSELVATLSEKKQEADKIKADRAKISGDVDALRKIQKGLGDDIEAMDKKVAALEPDSFLAKISAKVRAAPLMQFLNPSEKVAEVDLPNILTDVSFQKIPTIDRCATCHVHIDRKEFAPEKVIDFLERELASGRGYMKGFPPSGSGAGDSATMQRPGAAAMPEFWVAWGHTLLPNDRFITPRLRNPDIGVSAPLAVTDFLQGMGSSYAVNVDGKPAPADFAASLASPAAPAGRMAQDRVIVAAITTLYTQPGALLDPLAQALKDLHDKTASAGVQLAIDQGLTALAEARSHGLGLNESIKALNAAMAPALDAIRDKQDVAISKHNAAIDKKAAADKKAIDADAKIEKAKKTAAKKKVDTDAAAQKRAENADFVAEKDAAAAPAATVDQFMAFRNAALGYPEALRQAIKSKSTPKEYKSLMDQYRYALCGEVNKQRAAAGIDPLDASPVQLAHPRLDLYVDTDSPHPIDNNGPVMGVGCTACHDGSGQETNFVLAAHMARSIWVDESTGMPVLPEQLDLSGMKVEKRPPTLSSMLDAALRKLDALHLETPKPTTQPSEAEKSAEKLADVSAPEESAPARDYVDPITGNKGRAVPQAEQWKQKYEGESGTSFEEVYHMWDWPMRKPELIEANCARCHNDIHDIKEEAPTLYKGRALFAKYGCVNCHQMASVPAEDNRRVGPDLRHVSSKLSKEFVESWIWAPKAFRPSTMMPHFFMLENNSSDEELRRCQQETRAIAEYLFRTATPLDPNLPGAEGAQAPGGRNTGGPARALPAIDEAPDQVKARIERGRALFFGFGVGQGDAERPGGLGCVACHANLNDSPAGTGPTLGESWITLDLRKNGKLRAKVIEENAAHPLEDSDLDAKVAEEAKKMYDGMSYNERQLYAMENLGAVMAPISQPKYADGTDKPIFMHHGPELSAVGTKLLVGRTRQEAVKWLFDWLSQPRHYSDYTVMPNLRLSESEALDLVEYLLSQKRPDDEWQPRLIAPDQDKCQQIAQQFLLANYADREAFARANDDAEMTNRAADALAGKALTVDQAKRKIADEKWTLEQKRDFFIGKKLVSHYGCMQCHAINGTEELTTPCASLSDWGQKQVTKLDYGFLDPHEHDELPELTAVPMVNGLSPHATGVADTMGPGKWNDKVAAPIEAAWPMLEHTRESWLTQKLRNTRIFDRGKVLLDPQRAMEDGKVQLDDGHPRLIASGKPYDKLRMPTFYFNDEEIHALVTFVVSNRDHLITEKLANKSNTEEAQRIARGRQVVERYNCVSCHRIDANQPIAQEYWMQPWNESNRAGDYPKYGPPMLRGEGNKVQPGWLVGFLHNVQKIRPLPIIRMPSFPITASESQDVSAYFAAISNRESRHLKSTLDPLMKEAKARADVPSQIASARLRDLRSRISASVDHNVMFELTWQEAADQPPSRITLCTVAPAVNAAGQPATAPAAQPATPPPGAIVITDQQALALLARLSTEGFLASAADIAGAPLPEPAGPGATFRVWAEGKPAKSPGGTATLSVELFQDMGSDIRALRRIAGFARTLAGPSADAFNAILADTGGPREPYGVADDLWPDDNWYLNAKYQPIVDYLSRWAIRNTDIKESDLNPRLNTPAQLAKTYTEVLYRARFMADLYAAPYPFAQPWSPGDGATFADRFELGKRFFLELKCLQCHSLEPLAPGQQPAHRGFTTEWSAPNLVDASDRLQRRYIRHWVQETGVVQPNTPMPAQFSSLLPSDHPSHYLHGTTNARSLALAPEIIERQEKYFGRSADEQTDLLLDFLLTASQRRITVTQPEENSPELTSPPTTRPTTRTSPPAPQTPPQRPTANAPTTQPAGGKNTPPVDTTPQPVRPQGEVAIAGSIKLIGAPPKMQPIAMGVKECAEAHASAVLNEAVVAGENGELQNVVVWVSSGNVPADVAPPANPTIDQVGCQYVPHVTAVRVNQPVTVTNDDHFMHNIQGIEGGASLFNITQANVDKAGQKFTLNKPGPCTIKCSVHGWMTGYVYAVDSACFDVSDADGAFKLRGLPPGKYTVTAWHEVYGTVKKEVTVEAGKPATLDLTFTAK